VQAARRLLAGSDGTCHPHHRELDILASLTIDLQRCALEVRRLVDELRPPALDHGLESALRAQVRQFDAGSIALSLEVGGSLHGIPAAVEVAAYRIVAESLANMARHSHASRCSVRVDAGSELRLEIVDDGDGVRAAGSDGVGLRSIKERAAELGGACDISSPPGGGTRVSVDLPLGEFTPPADDAERVSAAPSLPAVASFSTGETAGLRSGADEVVSIPPQARPEPVV
jgi:two-component system, NarL family, sensor kinase